MLGRHLFSVVLVGAIVGCVGDDPTPSGASGSSSTNGAGVRSIVCDSKQTCTGANKCCGVGTDWIGSACKDDCGGAYTLTCDDANDCAAGQVCCYTTDGGARAVASFCAATCRADQKEQQLCALGVSGECKTGSCTPLTQFSPNGLAHCN